MSVNINELKVGSRVVYNFGDVKDHPGTVVGIIPEGIFVEWEGHPPDDPVYYALNDTLLDYISIDPTYIWYQEIAKLCALHGHQYPYS